MTKEEFEALLASLDLNRERAGEKYEQIRRKLLTFFRGRGVTDSERAADEVLDRSAKRSLEGGIETITLFIFGVARKVASEIQRNVREAPLDDAAGPPVNPIDYGEEQMEKTRHRCFLHCLKLLEPEQRELLETWYLYDKGQKIENRKRLATERQTTLETLRVRAFRAREKLRQLVEGCMRGRMSWPPATEGRSVVHNKETRV